MNNVREKSDVVVIGGGHAGIEAALASARLGKSTILFSMSLDFIGNLPCNPSIGGTAKGHLVREIDALGGEMGIAADFSTIQSKMLNRGKGPAVHSLRAQIDRSVYHCYTKQAIENQKNLQLIQAEITSIIVDGSGKVEAVKSNLDAVYICNAVILATGTFLESKIFIGEHSYSSGPDSLHAAQGLSKSLEKMGVELRRFKTGTPARVHSDTIDYSVLEIQAGEDPIIPFSFTTINTLENKLPCYIAYTNKDTHKLIQNNLDKSPLYGGKVEWVGARYCPSIEDKVVRFEGKDRHQIFIEPVGLNTKEMYLQGLSTSFPEYLQLQIYQSIKGLENVQIMRSAYAIEYDCIDPLQLLPTLEFKNISGLFSAGQVNGTSGYEEAAAQGLIAGINASKMIAGEDQLVLSRASSYIGTLIDDLVTKGTNEPYRMMTSRSEYRLLLRQDNADERLTPIGYKIGLICEKRFEMFHVKQNNIVDEKNRINKIVVSPTKKINKYLEENGTSPLQSGIRMNELLKRPQVTIDNLFKILGIEKTYTDDIYEQIEISIKYQGYISKQLSQVKQLKKLEKTILDKHFDYTQVKGLRIEAIEKLNKIKPIDLAQASRISGVSPSDISVLVVYIEQQKRGNK